MYFTKEEKIKNKKKIMIINMHLAIPNGLETVFANYSNFVWSRPTSETEIVVVYSIKTDSIIFKKIIQDE